MVDQSRLQRSIEKLARVRRHASAAFRYGTPRRFANLLRAEWEHKTRAIKVQGRPYMFILDPLNTCQLKCPMCATGLGILPLKGGKMRLEQFERVIDQISPYAFKVSLYNWGEPFLHREILPFIAYAHKKRMATGVSTNLNALPPEGGEGVVRSGLDDLIVSCDGLTQETYVQYRKEGELEKVVANLKEISEAKKRLKSKFPVIEFQYLVFGHNEHELPEVEQFAKDLGANSVRFVAPFIDLTQTDLKPSTIPKYLRTQYTDADYEPADNMFKPEPDQEFCIEKHPPPLDCFWPWRAMVVNWNGQIDPCCFGNYLDGFGNLFEKPLMEIWNGPEYTSARRWIAGKMEPEDNPHIVCKGCPGYF